MDISSMMVLHLEAEQIFDKFLNKIGDLTGIKDVIEADFGTTTFLEFDYADVDNKFDGLLISFNNDNYSSHLYRDVINYHNEDIDCAIISIPVKKFDIGSLTTALIENKFYVIHNIVHYLDFKANGQYEWKDLDTENKIYNSAPEFKAFYLEAMYKFCHGDDKVKNVEDLMFKLRKYLPNKFRTTLYDRNKEHFYNLSTEFYSTLHS